MISTNIIITIICVYILISIVLKIKIKNKQYYYRLSFILFVTLNIFVILFLIANYYLAYTLYTKGILEAPRGLLAKSLLENIKVILIYSIYNILFTLEFVFKNRTH